LKPNRQGLEEAATKSLQGLEARHLFEGDYGTIRRGGSCPDTTPAAFIAVASFSAGCKAPGFLRPLWHGQAVPFQNRSALAGELL
jgi:hypothetical protein